MDYEIGQLTFGRSNAESEVEKLDEYFVATQAYVNAKSPFRRKVFYIGHRGTGKSALLNKLARELERDNNNIILNITPKQFSYELFEGRKHDYADVRSVYAAVWHYTLVIQLFKSLLLTLAHQIDDSVSHQHRKGQKVQPGQCLG